MRIDPSEVVITDRINPDEVEIVQPPAPKPDSVLDRMRQGFLDPIVGAAQLAEKIPGLSQARKFLTGSDTTMEDVVKHGVGDYKGTDAYVAPEGVDWARMGGNVANPLSWAGGGASPLRAAYAGGMQGALAPVNSEQDFAAEKAQQVGLGAAGGAVLSKALAGLRPTKEAKALMDQGIQPTVGQSLGGGFNDVEQKLTSMPFVGNAVSHARNRAQNEFERATLARPFSEAAQPSGFPPSMLNQRPKDLDEANNFASEVYKAVTPHLVPTKEALEGVWGALETARQNPEMTSDAYKILGGLVQKHFTNFDRLSGEGIKKLDSELGHLARKYSGGSPADKTLAGEIYRVQAAFREGLEPGLPLGLQDAMKRANYIWKSLIPINQAASARADEKIMPRALQRAMARQQKTDPTRLPFDPLVDNALKVLPSNVPDSGSAGRLLGASIPALATGAVLSVPALAGVSRPAQAALLGNTAWQKALAPYDANFASAIAAALRGQGNE
jgi:hypothetical protein